MKSSKIIIMAKSEIAGKFAPTAHGTFSSVKEAEEYGAKNIKSLQWVVANEVVREKLDGVETSYEYVSHVKTPGKIYNGLE